MKLPSISVITRGIAGIFKRFPFVVVVSIIGTICAILSLEGEYDPKDVVARIVMNLLLASALGLPIFIATTLTAEKMRWSNSLKLGIQSAFVVALGLYCWVLPAGWWLVEWWVNQFFLLNAGFHLLVAVAPFLAKNQFNGFWQYNKTLFLRILTAVLFATVLHLGLVTAIYALKVLLGLDLGIKWYLKQWIFIMGIFNTWFFLAGIPENLDSLESETGYPKGLKIFTQYVLMPLVTIYLVILYLYAGKILIAWDLPKGMVSGLVLGFSITGIFSLLLVFPIQELEENRWMKIFSRWFYRAVIPLVFILFLAAWRRISDYGFTESRYLLMILAFWLAGISLYFTISRAKNIKSIPLSLAVLAFVISFGPWGMFKVSERSQVRRLESILQQNSLLADGKIIDAKQVIPQKDRQEIRSILFYLERVHSLNVIQSWTEGKIQLENDKPANERNNSKKILSLWGIDTLQNEEIPKIKEEKSNYLYSTAGYDYVSDFSFGKTLEPNRRNRAKDSDTLPTVDNFFKSQDFALKLHIDIEKQTLVLAKEKSTDSLNFNFKNFADSLSKQGEWKEIKRFADDKLIIEAENTTMKAKIQFQEISFESTGNSVNNFSLNQAKGKIFIKLKQ